MESQGLTATDLARRAGVRATFLYDILNGKSRNPSAVRLAQVAEALGISLAALTQGMERAAIPGYIAIPSLRDAPLPDGEEGRQIIQGIDRDPHYFRESWLQDRFSTGVSNLRIHSIRGDSMAPTLHHRDLVLLDTAQTRPAPPGIFVLHDHDGFTVNRLEYASPHEDSIHVLSDNPAYRSRTHPVHTLRIIGRILWFSREI